MNVVNMSEPSSLQEIATKAIVSQLHGSLTAKRQRTNTSHVWGENNVDPSISDQAFLHTSPIDAIEQLADMHNKICKTSGKGRHADHPQYPTGFVARVSESNEHEIRIRIDDTANLPFWCEVSISKDELRKHL